MGEEEESLSKPNIRRFRVGHIHCHVQSHIVVIISEVVDVDGADEWFEPPDHTNLGSQVNLGRNIRVNHNWDLTLASYSMGIHSLN